ncbi:unnamed protein product [Candida verbasci]|uniref:Uncharacterized protein n=1 Tax=Candida verbasci TaxID=1227364 RepID=A0A9W4U0T4_9ASCO|nr:unnamed protein product [Candida verbasci]
MSDYDVQDDFYQLITNKYNEAVKNKHILFNGDSVINETETIKVGDENFDVQYTLLTSLMHRPEKGDNDSNPFEKPEPELTIFKDYGANNEFKIIFNKFPVVPKHFMLVTQQFKSQNTPLSSNELYATYQILQNLNKFKSKGEDWFAFYNCGQESGASQPHKHIQFMTLPSRDKFIPYTDIISNQQPSELLKKNEPLQNKSLPFANFIKKIPKDEEITGEILSQLFASLLQKTLTTLRQNDADHISYNFIMTIDYVYMVPRSNGKFQDKIGINSCGVQGLFLCKDEELFKLVKEYGPFNILKDVGFLNTSDKASNEYDY